MVKDETALRAAMRAWLDACDAVDTAMSRPGGEYADSITLAETAAVARLRLHQELVAAGWSPPRQTSHQA